MATTSLLSGSVSSFLLHSLVCFFLIPHVSGNIQYLSLSLIPSRSTHVVVNGKTSFFFSGWVTFHCVCVPCLLYPLTCGWTLRLLPCFGCCSNAAVDTVVCVSIHTRGFVFLEGDPAVAVLPHVLALLLGLRRRCVVLHSGRADLHSRQQWRRVLFSPVPHQRVPSGDLLMTAILTDERWSPTGALICISLMMNDAEHLFMCLLATCVFFEKLSIQIRHSFLNWIVWVFW